MYNFSYGPFDITNSVKHHSPPFFLVEKRREMLKNICSAKWTAAFVETDTMEYHESRRNKLN